MARQAESEGFQLFFSLLSLTFMILTIGTGRMLLDYTSTLDGMGPLITTALIILSILYIAMMYFVFLTVQRRVIELMRSRKGFGNSTDSDEYF